jgi:hypothetical protein
MTFILFRALVLLGDPAFAGSCNPSTANILDK